ncbi:hypothetical protein HDU67_009972 [Dinochytrium kinnereticum]|nr:hypothetical protein HDU67_009972 [Dinochytrium kinnereticum]
MLFDSSALVLSLVASVIVKWEATEAFTYGYGRVETLTGFANALALVFASLGIIWEGLERLFDPPSIKMDNLLTVSVLGFLVNIGMFLHVLADTFGSIGVIVSSILINLYGWTWADPLASLLIAALTLLSIWPLLAESTSSLLQRIPPTLLGRTSEAYRRVQLVEGVVGFSQPHFWELCQGKNFGTIKIQVRSGTGVDRVRVAVCGIFREYGITDLVVQIEQDVVVGY